MVHSCPSKKRLLQKRLAYFFLLFAVPILLLSACKKSDTVPAPTPTPTPQPVDNTTPLKDLADFPIGVAINYTPTANDPKYAAIVRRDFDAVTFGWEMKHGAVVRNDGSKDYSLADAMMNQSAAARVSVFGHTLVWYQNNNGDYLRSLTATVAPTGNDLLADLNGNFDKAGTGTLLFDSWSGIASGNALAAFNRETDAAAQQGTSSVKITVTTPGANAWDVQLLNQDWKPVQGKTYQIRFWVKSAGGSSFRAVNQTPNAGSPHFASFTVTPTANWTEVTWNYTAPANAIQFGFHFPAAGTFWIDNVSIRETTVSQINSAVAAVKMDSVMKDWIQSTVNRYKASVRAWDVVNEPFTDGMPVLRNGTNSAGDTYYWAQYLGRDYIARAFRYAKEADPGADFFLNDYNLESNPAKLDSIIALANALKAANVPITGIGTQMHIFVNTPQSGIDQMMQKLAATGLKIRVSELDVRLRNTTTSVTPPATAELENQAAMYKYVVSAYKKYIPAAQRAGITVWGVTDNTSWLFNNGADYPLIYDKDYNRKPAYAAFLQGLRSGG